MRLQLCSGALSMLLQVSWLGAWLLLLGFRDYQHEDQLWLGFKCLRPEESQMLELTQLWARIAAAAEVGSRKASVCFSVQ